ncbi:MAG: hypothetical protein D6679_07095 [Candidatus Hydrogenedentota bacterium]|nr:MAG: hypothetical protein D6679_07095 [Candidatus Hydrogenedentota bacterium]
MSFRASSASRNPPNAVSRGKGEGKGKGKKKGTGKGKEKRDGRRFLGPRASLPAGAEQVFLNCGNERNDKATNVPLSPGDALYRPCRCPTPRGCTHASPRRCSCPCPYRYPRWTRFRIPAVPNPPNFPFQFPWYFSLFPVSPW